MNILVKELIHPNHLSKQLKHIFNLVFTVFFASFLSLLNYQENAGSFIIDHPIHSLYCFAQRNPAQHGHIRAVHLHFPLKGKENRIILPCSGKKGRAGPQGPQNAIWLQSFPEFSGPGTRHIYFRWINTVTQWTANYTGRGLSIAFGLTASV